MKKLIWKILVGILGDNIYRQLSFLFKYYHISFKDKACITPCQIYCLDGRYTTCGFADRLRGIISVYAYAKANNLPFRINHEVPFRFEDFFSPNLVNWRMNEGEISYNALKTNPIVMMDYTKGERFPFISPQRQHHFYININALQIINNHYHKNYKYSGLFQELFKPSTLLEKEISPFKEYIKKGYISISFRFLQLMGDFTDVCGRTLNETEQQDLSSRCLHFIEKIHERHSNVPHVLITTDSFKFAEICSNALDYVFFIPGKIGHVGFCNSFDVNMKMIVDFYMISKAQKAYLGYTGEMYKSKFAQSAAETTEVPFEAINF